MRLIPILMLTAALGMALPAPALHAQEAEAATAVAESLPAITVAEVTKRRLTDRVIAWALLAPSRKCRSPP